MPTAPSLDDYVGAFRKATDFVDANVTKLRAPLKERTMFGPAGRAVLRSKGERVIYGPNGAALCRVTEDEMHGTQVEEDERLHAVVRPGTVRVLVSRSTGEVIPCP